MAKSLITIHTLWGWRKSEDGPELLEAWDAGTVDNWHEGWEAACKKALDACGDDLTSHRYIEIYADYDEITQAFFPVVIEAVESSGDGRHG